MIVGIILLVFCVLIITKMQKSSKEFKERNEEFKKLLGEKKATAYSFLTHVNGLPVAENVTCKIISCPGHYEFIANGTTINLEKSKLTDLSVKTETEIQKQYVSSVGGAVAGAVLLGPLGAVVGGRSKQKESKTVNKYLIFTYMSDGKIKYITFKTYGSEKALLNDYKEYNKSNGKESVSISL